MAKHNRYAAHNHNSNDLKYDFYRIRLMITSMFNTYRSELQGIPSKLKLHAIPKQDRNTVLRTKQEQTNRTEQKWG